MVFLRRHVGTFCFMSVCLRERINYKVLQHKNHMTDNISSESKLVWKLIKNTMLFPVTLLLVLLGKREAKELLAHLRDLWEFFWEAKVTAVLMVTNILVFFLVALLLAPSYGGDAFITRFSCISEQRSAVLFCKTSRISQL